MNTQIFQNYSKVNNWNNNNFDKTTNRSQINQSKIAMDVRVSMK